MTSFMNMLQNKFSLPKPEEALKGRIDPIAPIGDHAVFSRPMDVTAGKGQEEIILGMGCFWGAERLFWQQTGVVMTSVGYAGGYTPNPTYQEVCSGQTGHAEVVRVIFDQALISLDEILALFWQNHDPTQGMRQGNDRGTQYRSALYWKNDDFEPLARQSATHYQQRLTAQRHNAVITTEFAALSHYYFAEPEHQQYLAKNPQGYCALSGTGIAFDKSN